MFGNEVRPILPTSPTVEKLQFLCIINERLGFTVHNLYLNTTILITTSSQNRTPCRHPTSILWAWYVTLALLGWPCPLIMLSLTMIHTKQMLKKKTLFFTHFLVFSLFELGYFSLSPSSEIFLLFFFLFSLQHSSWSNYSRDLFVEIGFFSKVWCVLWLGKTFFKGQAGANLVEPMECVKMWL